MVAEVEAATTYKDLVDATLAQGLMPAVVPQFTTITIGGAVSGGACEASSFKYGAVHETVLEMTVLLATGEVVTATPANKHKDLFYGLANTFGSLGYILKLKIKLVPVKPFVRLQHVAFTSIAAYMKAIQEIWKTSTYKGQPVDFLDGMVLSKNELYLTIAHFTDTAPYTSDYTYMQVFYKSIPQKRADYLTVHDFIWRWETDWVWGSKAFGMQNKALRLLLGKFMLNSRAYWKLVNLDRRYNIAKRLKALRPKAAPKEIMVQDAEVPVDRSGAFLTFFLDAFDLRPIWVCPLKSFRPEPFPFSALDPKERYINFGFWGSVTTDAAKLPHHYNRLLEQRLANFDGVKALYSTNFYPQAEFWRIFDKKHYDALKATLP
jgi:FAD/FMN-containing dehydrogenase